MIAGSRPDPLSRAMALCAVALGLALYLVRPGATPLQRGNEAAYAFPAMQMVETGDYLVTNYQGEHFLDKPPLSLWMIALSYRLFGVSVWAARLPSALAGLATVLIVGLWVRRRSGESAGWLAALMLLFSFQFVFVAMTFAADAFLTLGIVVAILVLDTAARRQDGSAIAWGAACGSALAFAFGAKGLVGVVLPVGTVAAALLLDRSRPVQLLQRGAWSLLVLVLLVAPWHVAMSRRLGAEFWEVFYWKNQFLRGATGVQMRAPRSPFYYLEVLAWAIFPWSLQLLAPPPRPRASRLPLAWLLFGLAFWSVMVMKREVYLAPVLPAACALVAEGLASEDRPDHWRRRAAWALSAIVAWAAAILWVRGSGSVARLAGQGAALAVGIALLVLAAVLTAATARAARKRVLFATALSCGLLCMALSILDQRLGRFDPIPEWGARVRAECAAGCDAFLVGPKATSLDFYSGMDWSLATEPLERIPGMMRHRTGYVLIPTNWEPKLSGLPLHWAVVERRADIGRRSADILFHPEEALESISLVRIEN